MIRRLSAFAAAFFCMLCLILVPLQMAQAPMTTSVPKITNADVVELVGMGMSDDVVIDKIYASKGTNFDTSISGLKSLKAAKVSDNVIRVMINPQGPNMPNANAAPDSQAQIVAPQPGADVQQGPPAPPPGPVVYFKSTDGKTRIYVTDHPINEFIAVGRASSGTYANANHISSQSSSAGVAHAEKGDDPRTVEIQADVQKLCPAYITVSNNPERADYILVFRRQGGKRTSAFAFGGLAGLAIAAGAKVDGSSLFELNGDMVYATKENSVEKAIKATCEHIPAPAGTPTPTL